MKTNLNFKNTFQKYTNSITTHDILEAKKLLPRNAVISIKDKNTNQLFIECPIAFKERLLKETDKCTSLKKITKSRAAALKEISDHYQALNLHRFGKLLSGQLPYMYVIPKDKDPINKSRLIASYCKHPLRQVYKNTAKVLFWCLEQIKKSSG